MKIILTLALIVVFIALGSQAVSVQAQDPPDSPVATPTSIIDPDQPARTRQ